MCLGLRIPWIECDVRYVGYILAEGNILQLVGWGL